MKKKNWISNLKISPMLLIGLAFLFVILLGSLLLFLLLRYYIFDLLTVSSFHF
ncbi:MAG: hypothetical protein PUC70_01265 [bacterium]|nr:hypothetical protein [bacterium]